MTPAPPRYFNCIDAIRMLAALAIVIFHYHHFYLANYQARPDLPPISSFPYASLFEPIFLNGDKAVEMFWMISGFVFMHVYLRTPTGFGRFAMARFARLYPLHLATLLIVAALQWISRTQTGSWQIYGNNTDWHFMFQLFLASNNTTYAQGLSFNGPIWSVSLEITAYLAFFLALWGLRRFGMVAAGLLCFLCWSHPVWPFPRPPLLHPGVYDCGGYFFAGVTLYFVFLRTLNRPVLLLGLAAVFAGLAAEPPVFALYKWDDALMSAAILLAAAYCDTRLQEAGKPLRAAGNISYSLYLVHVPLQMAVLLVADLFFDSTRAFAQHPVTMPLYLVATIAVASGAFIAFERPVGRFLRGLVFRSEPQKRSHPE